MSNMPCWLTPKDKAIALALIEKAGFDYLGSPDEFGIYDFKIATILGWRLGGAYGELAIEAVRDGAVFGKSLELLPEVDYSKEIHLAKQTIRAAAKEWDEAQAKEFTQLTLPLIVESKKTHPTSTIGKNSSPQKSKRSPTEVSDRCYLS